MSDAPAPIPNPAPTPYEIGGFVIDPTQQPPATTPGEWPFHTDAFHMGAVPAEDFAVMFARFGHPADHPSRVNRPWSDLNEYIIHHIPTGRRLRIQLPKE